MSVVLYRLARWSFRRRWLVLSAWLVLAATIVTVAIASGGKTTDGLTIPGSESQQLATVLEQKLPAASGASTQVVFAVKSGDVSDPQYRAGIDAALTKLAAMPQVVNVDSPFDTGAVSPDGKVALAAVNYDVTAGEVQSSTIDAFDPSVTPARDAGVQVEFSGEVYGHGSSLLIAEIIGLAVAVIILVIVLGSFIAGGLPVVTALLGVVVSIMAMTALAAVTDIAGAATTVGTMLGLSCGIDYALLILSRHRNFLLAGHPPEEAAGRAAGTAGSSVVFAGLSVVIALCGLVVVGIPFLAVMGLAAAGAVILALLVALTLLPALFGFAGMRVARFSRLPVLRRAKAATTTAVERPEELTGTRWAAFVVRRRIPILVIGVATLGAMAIPIVSLDLGLPGASSRPDSDTSRRAYDLTTEHFGPGYNGALTVVAQNATDESQATELATSLSGIAGVASATPRAVTNGIAIISVTPTTGPNDKQTKDLVQRLRDDRSQIEGDTGTSILVGGKTAADIDVSNKLGAALPIFVVVVAALAFVLLAFAFGSLVIPIKSIVGFLLSVGAAFGAEVAVFQWGWLAGPLGIDKSQTLSFLPVILIAIVFGLSSDYEVFVVSRIKEHFTKHGDARHAVVVGTGQAARVVTAAALIMASVFASFLLGNDPVIKAIGFSFALGVLIDAFVVRLTLVPAIMAVLGEKAWYRPAWFAKYVPDPDIEGERLDAKLHHDDSGDSDGSDGSGRPGAEREPVNA